MKHLWCLRHYTFAKYFFLNACYYIATMQSFIEWIFKIIFILPDSKWDSMIDLFFTHTVWGQGQSSFSVRLLDRGNLPRLATSGAVAHLDCRATRGESLKWDISICVPLSRYILICLSENSMTYGVVREWFKKI